MTPSKDKDKDKNDRKTASVFLESEVTTAVTCPRKKSKSANTVREPPREIDIVCGRGCGHYARAPGNVSYRRLVGLSLSRYEKARKYSKVEISREIVQVIKAQQGTPRFLMENPTTKVWEEISYTKSVAKTSQAFRNARSRTMSKATSADESDVDDDEGGVSDDDESYVIQDLRSKNNGQGDN